MDEEEYRKFGWLDENGNVKQNVPNEKTPQQGASNINDFLIFDLFISFINNYYRY